MRRPSSAFTLNEVIICIAVVSIAFLGTFSALVAAQRSTAYGQRMSLATGYCRQICEIIRARGLATSSQLSAPGSLLQTNPPDRKDIPVFEGAPFVSIGSGDPNRSNFTRSITTQRVASSGFEQNLYRVHVTVWWREGERWAKVQMQTLSRVPLT